MLSVASVIVVTAFPLVLKRSPHQAAWWGGILLLISMIAFIGAFLLAGFVTVAYKAPDPGCASLLCEDCGIECTTFADTVDNIGAFVLDPNMAALNNLVPANDGSFAFCLQYNASVATSAETVTLYPVMPDCSGSDQFAVDQQWDRCFDVRQLLESDYVQQQVVSASLQTLTETLTQLSVDSNTYTIPISVSTLAPYTSLTEFYQADSENYLIDLLLPDYQFANRSLVPYAGLRYQCHSQGDDTSNFNTLCDMYEGLSVSKRGESMTEATASMLVLESDMISAQLAITVEELSGFFGLVLLIIIGYIIKSKIK